MMIPRASWAFAAIIAGVALSSAATTACGEATRDNNFGEGASSGAPGGQTGGPGSSGGGAFGSSGGGVDGAAEDDACKKMDIVFVVDNSGSMEEEQKNLAKNFPNFANVINDYKTKGGAPLDYRLAVTSSDDMLGQGEFQRTPGRDAPEGCSAGPSRPWLERPDGNVAATFACRAQLGTFGSGLERPLEAALLSVTARIDDKRNTDNGKSFVRDDALLALVIISDEDEGSADGIPSPARPMDRYPSEFDKLKRDRGRWAAAVIAGPTDCYSEDLGDAAEAKRLKGFISDVGDNGVFASICDGDLTKGLSQALATFDQACKNFPVGGVK